MLDHVLKAQITKGGTHNYKLIIKELEHALNKVNKIKNKLIDSKSIPEVLRIVQGQVDFIDREDIKFGDDEDNLIDITLPQLIYNRYQNAFATTEIGQLKEILQLMAQLAFPNIKGVKNSNQNDFFKQLRADRVIADTINQPITELQEKTRVSTTNISHKNPLLPKNGDGSVSHLFLYGNHQQPFANADLQPVVNHEEKQDDCSCKCVIL